MDVVVEMLGEEPLSTQTVPLPFSVGASMELVVVNTNQTEFIPLTVGVAPTSEGSLDIPIVRAMVSLEQSSSSEEVVEGLKRKKSMLAHEQSIVPAGMTSNKRRLVKESEWVSSRRGTPSSLPPRKSSMDKKSKGKGRESLSQDANDNLLTALIPNESRLHFQLNPDSTQGCIFN